MVNAEAHQERSHTKRDGCWPMGDEIEGIKYGVDENHKVWCGTKVPDDEEVALEEKANESKRVHYGDDQDNKERSLEKSITLRQLYLARKTKLAGPCIGPALAVTAKSPL